MKPETDLYGYAIINLIFVEFEVWPGGVKMNNLVKLDDYGLITFNSTTQALKAEKILKAAGVDFLLVPIPREISASCGLAIKACPEDIGFHRDLLLQDKVAVGATYRIEPMEKGRKITCIIPGADL